MDSSSDFGRFRRLLSFWARSEVNVQWQRKFDPSDIVQETLLQAHRSQDKLRKLDEPQVTVWLRKAMEGNLQRTFRDLTRQKRDARRERPLGTGFDGTTDHLARKPGAQTTSPSGCVARQETSEALAKGMLGLTEAQREAIVLVYLEGLTATEAGKRMDRAPKAVAALLHRGLAQLEKNLDGRL